VRLIDWQNPGRNDFGIAEEVTLRGGHERRPDLVLYVNGIAVGVIELKNSRVAITEGIRQLLSNQLPEFNERFFSTVQIVFAGNDSEGLQYGTIRTEEKYFLRWKEDEQDDSRLKLDKYLLKMCGKERLIELMHDFVLFDAGTKKLPRVHQYFGVKAAQAHVKAYKGGIIWHTQGSGKSIVMVLLAKWILENNPRARVVVVTDRDELDKQIEGVFQDAGETIHRTSSGADLLDKLGKATPRLLCSLVHKFGHKEVDDYNAFIHDLRARPCHTVGELFVFVDECHRTESGRLHETMKAILKDAVFIGFTGTPLLKKDKKTSQEVFGGYIHTYKFNEGVEDKVVLDLLYEARDIEQELGSQDRIDAWFDAKTRGLNDWQKAALREQWGTMQNVLSSRSRMERVVNDIVFDFSTKPRLNNDRGTAMLVVSSIYEACKYFELFQRTTFRGKCAVVTSYDPQAADVTREETGANSETDRQFIYNTYLALLEGIDAEPGKTRTEVYEDRAKARYKAEPANMKLLVVVDKLLTGFDAPSCSYLYIDKSMQDHGLFQAICRTNRLDGDDKDFGYIVDYKDLFTKVKDAIAVYTSELDKGPGELDSGILMQDRLTKSKERLEAAREAVVLLCEPVPMPKSELEHIRYFCGNTEIAEDLANHKPQRVGLYKAVAGLVRAYASLADDLEGAGYSDAEIAEIKRELDSTLKLRETIRRASGETIDLKAYEADMRHLIDTYIEAASPRKISHFDNMGLLELIVKSGIAKAVNSLPEGIRSSKEAVAETIANNVRSKIIKEHLNDPAYYDRMSVLLEEIIADLRARRISYEDYLKRVADLARRVQVGMADDIPEPLKASCGLRAIYNHLQQGAATETGKITYGPATDAKLDLAVRIADTVKTNAQDGWRGGVDQGADGSARHLPDCGGRGGDAPDLQHCEAASGVLMAPKLELGGIKMEVVLKDIKNVHLSVYPPAGRVRVSAPRRMNLDTIRVFVISKLGWIRQQQRKLLAQERESPREYIGRESHYLWGRRYLLRVVEADRPPGVERTHSRMTLHVRPGTLQEKKAEIVEAWYREQLRAAVPALVATWEPLLGVKLDRFFIQRMRTRWGSCSPHTRTIRLNTELAKKPPQCLEYIVVHELIHLLEPTHNARFTALLDRHLPPWRLRRDELNRLPVRHEEWGY
jgi:type I restriction enzyme R subunit